MCEPLFVLIPTAGERPDQLDRTLRSLSQAAKPEGYCESWVLLNGPDLTDDLYADQPRDKADPQERIKPIVDNFADTLATWLMRMPGTNKSGALNRALSRLSDTFVVMIDDDVTVGPQLLQHYAAAAACYGPNHFFGGSLSVSWARDPDPWLKPYLSGSEAGWTPLQGDQSSARQTHLGGHWAAFASDVKAVGGFDERRGPGSASGGQETECQWRLIYRGAVSVYLPGCTAQHHLEREHLDAPGKLRRVYRNARSLGMLDAEGQNFTISNQIFWRFKHYMRRGLWSMKQSWLKFRLLAGSKDPSLRFAHDYWQKRRRGMIDGFRYAFTPEGQAHRPRSDRVNQLGARKARPQQGARRTVR